MRVLEVSKGVISSSSWVEGFFWVFCPLRSLMKMDKSVGTTRGKRCRARRIRKRGDAERTRPDDLSRSHGAEASQSGLKLRREVDRQRPPKRLATALKNFLLLLAHHFGLAVTATFWEPTSHSLCDPCTTTPSIIWFLRGVASLATRAREQGEKPSTCR